MFELGSGSHVKGYENLVMRLDFNGLFASSADPAKKCGRQTRFADAGRAAVLWNKE